MGDVIHTLPALTDATKVIPNISFDWVVEENFQEIPRWHAQVKNIIPIALRRWRKNIFSATTLSEMQEFRKKLRENTYDLIIDAQGLFKSAIVSCLARGVLAGPDYSCARDPLAAFLYQQKHFAGKVKEVHAVTRARQLFSKALAYEMPDTVADYGVDRESFAKPSDTDFLVFLHGTTWTTKHWPEAYWIELAAIAAKQNFKIKLPWGSVAEHERAQRIAASCPAAEVLPKLNLQGIASVLAGAKAIVAVDTGLGHLAAALDVPTVSLYGPTNPVLTGAMGRSQKLLKTDFSCSPCLSRECIFPQAKSYAVQPPCFSTLPPSLVWAELEKLL